ncbi:hypothetical protein Tco_1561641 [Tanacetum coccineum]
MAIRLRLTCASLLSDLVQKPTYTCASSIDDVSFLLSELMRTCDMTNLSLLSCLGAQELTTLSFDFEKPLVLPWLVRRRSSRIRSDKVLKLKKFKKDALLKLFKIIKSRKVEPLDETQLEDLGLNTCNHDIPLSSREVPSFDEPEPQPQSLLNCPPLDVNLGDERDPEPPIKPLSLDSFRIKVVDLLTIHTPPSPHLASFHPKEMYCYHHLCIDNPKKHYGFKLGLFEHNGSLGVDFANFEMIEDDWQLESKEVSFLRRGINTPIWQKEVENVRIK